MTTQLWVLRTYPIVRETQTLVCPSCNGEWGDTINRLKCPLCGAGTGPGGWTPSLRITWSKIEDDE